MVSKVTISSLIRDGFLVDCKIFTRNVVSLKDVKIKLGDYSEPDMYSEFDKNIVYSGVVKEWKRIWRETGEIK